MSTASPASTTTSLLARRAVRAARLFDGLVAHGPALVVIEDGRIVGVDLSGAEPPSDLPVDDLGDVTLLPGLVDAHTHLVFDASPDAAVNVRTTPPDTLLEQMRTSARAMLACGITTARDLGDRDYLTLALRDELAGHPTGGPTLVAAGPPLTSRAGHCWFLGGEVEGVDGITASIREHAERGVDVIKVMATGGRMTPTTLPHESQFTPAELTLAVDTAHGLGLPVAAHAHGRPGIVDALAAGVDTLEHFSFMTEAGFEPDEDVIAEVARADVLVSMTAGFLPGAPLPPPLAANLPKLARYMLHLHDLGLRFALGPDGGISPAKPHIVLPHAISELVAAAGLPVNAVLTSATVRGAEACRLQDRKGHVRTGYDADLLAVDGNLFTDIDAIHHPVAVYRGGVLV